MKKMGTNTLDKNKLEFKLLPLHHVPSALKSYYDAAMCTGFGFDFNLSDPTVSDQTSIFCHTVEY